MCVLCPWRPVVVFLCIQSKELATLFAKTQAKKDDKGAVRGGRALLFLLFVSVAEMMMVEDSEGLFQVFKRRGRPMCVRHHAPGKGGKGGKAGGKSDKVQKANIVDSGRVHKIGIALSKLKVRSFSLSLSLSLSVSVCLSFCFSFRFFLVTPCFSRSNIASSSKRSCRDLLCACCVRV